ncbi:MaoC/PaaZ C-terminal domain-containing protein [Bavariicoccus seileri]|uniref:MaoC/PaaZ C-terminal domain-containing protein n=1 Tax=Bavariicoccus seileri TaxID=549685 RepID=UPI003F937411
MTTRLGRTISELHEGDTMSVTEVIDQRDILIYLGLTNDVNPVYTPERFIDKSEFNEPIVPPVLLMGYITSTVSRHFPGPGSIITDFSISIFKPIYSGDTLTFHYQIDRVNERRNSIRIRVVGHNLKDEVMLDANIDVDPYNSDMKMVDVPAPSVVPGDTPPAKVKR